MLTTRQCCEVPALSKGKHRSASPASDSNASISWLVKDCWKVWRSYESEVSPEDIAHLSNGSYCVRMNLEVAPEDVAHLSTGTCCVRTNWKWPQKM